MMGNAELLQNFDSGFHGCPIAFGAHNDGDFVISSLSIAHSLLSRRSNIRRPKVCCLADASKHKIRVKCESVCYRTHQRVNAFTSLFSEKRRASYHTEIVNHISSTAVDAIVGLRCSLWLTPNPTYARRLAVSPRTPTRPSRTPGNLHS